MRLPRRDAVAIVVTDDLVHHRTMTRDGASVDELRRALDPDDLTTLSRSLARARSVRFFLNAGVLAWHYHAVQEHRSRWSCSRPVVVATPGRPPGLATLSTVLFPQPPYRPRRQAQSFVGGMALRQTVTSRTT